MAEDERRGFVIRAVIVRARVVRGETSDPAVEELADLILALAQVLQDDDADLRPTHATEKKGTNAP